MLLNSVAQEIHILIFINILRHVEVLQLRICIQTIKDILSLELILPMKFQVSQKTRSFSRQKTWAQRASFLETEPMILVQCSMAVSRNMHVLQGIERRTIFSPRESNADIWVPPVPNRSIPTNFNSKLKRSQKIKKR